MNRTQDKGFGTAGGGRSMPINSCAPGPGQYTLGYDLDHAHRFGKSTRDEKGKHGTPGPGTYSQKSGYGGEGVTMKSRNKFGEFITTNKTPGPGQYNPDLRASKGGNQGSKVGTGQRSNFVGKGPITPGPGHHNALEWDVHSRKDIGSRFGCEEDRSKALISNSKTPGPGAYSIGSHSNAPAYSMSGAKYDKDLSGAPGPGKYMPNFSNKGDERASLIGRGPRSQISVGKKGPGPGAYNPNSGLGSATYSIGTSLRTDAKQNKVPGPGQYHVPYYVAEVPRYQMPNKPDQWRFV